LLAAVMLVGGLAATAGWPPLLPRRNLQGFARLLPAMFRQRRIARVDGMVPEVRKHFDLAHDEARHSFISYHVAPHRSIGDAALQAGNSESIVKRHYLNTHTQDEGSAFIRTVPDLAARKAVLSPQQIPTARKHLRAV
jgi:hypothetical protein